MPRPLPDGYSRRLRHHYVTGLLWWVGHFGIGIVGIVASAIATTAIDNPQLLTGCSVTAAVCTSLVTFLNAKQHGTNRWLAWRHLNRACLRYQSVDGMTPEELYEALKESDRFVDAADLPPLSKPAKEG